MSIAYALEQIAELRGRINKLETRIAALEGSPVQNDSPLQTTVATEPQKEEVIVGCTCSTGFCVLHGKPPIGAE